MSTARESFDDERQRIMQSGTPSHGGDLLGIEMDFHAYLTMLDEIDDPFRDGQEDRRPRAADLRAARPPWGVTVAAAADAVCTAWLDSLRYGFIEAHHLDLDGDRATLDVVTQTAPDGLYVTGTIEIRPSKPCS